MRNDEFLISAYINHHDSDQFEDTLLQSESKSDNEAVEWSKSNSPIIHRTNTLKELESLWMDYNQSTQEERDNSDNKSIELFGISNIEHYNKLRSEFLKDDFTDSFDKTIIPKNGFSEAAGFDGISYSMKDVEDAINFSTSSGIPMIYPVRSLKELEDLWNLFLQYPENIRNQSETESVRFFGISNEVHYNYLKSQFLKEDIPDVEISESSSIRLNRGEKRIKIDENLIQNESVDTCSKAAELFSLLIQKKENYENVITKDMVDKVTGDYLMSHQNINYDPIPFEDLPFFTPEEIVDAGVSQSNPEDNFYGCEPSEDVFAENVEEWFTSYCNNCCGIPFEYDSVKWINNIRNLFLKMRTAENKDPYKQALLTLGWPPEAEFSPENRVIAKNRINTILRDRNGTTQFIDLTGFADSDDSISEGSVAIENSLKPVFIVLEEGKSVLSAIIKKATKSTYSHAALSFDPEMKTMYSYGIEGSERGAIGGFIKENIEDKDPNKHMAVFAIFLKEDDWNKLKNIVDDFVKNTKKTSYSYINLIISHIFRIPLNMDKKMVCSQFVDRVLKLTDIDISKKNSALVAPADFQKYARENKKIYILFDDIVKKFNPKRIKSVLGKLVKKADPIKEFASMNSIQIVYEMINNIHNLGYIKSISNSIDKNSLDLKIKMVYEVMIEPCLFAECYFNEAKNFPVQFDKWGNLFINNIKKRNYEDEYQNSHTLLKEYQKADNIEGIKYELYRLWAIELAIQDRLSSSKFKKMSASELAKTEEMKVHAKIINDFKYYVAIVMEADPKYNFTKEFEKSPFNSNNIKISKDTIKWSSKTLKAIMTSI